MRSPRRAWTQALEAFASAGELEAADHERVAIAAYLTGADERCERAWATAHHAALAAGDSAEAARCAFWLGLCLMLRGQMAHAGGWLSRAESIVTEADAECAASGYLLIPALLGALDCGDAAGAHDLALGAVDIGRRFDDGDLRAFGMLGLGQALIARGDTAEGTARLDEVMVSVTASEVGPITAGIVYCAVILECMALFDLPRAAEWTGALSDWCEAQPDLVPYRGQCLVHRSQLHMAAGQWSDAVAAADAACRRLTDPPHPALGLALIVDRRPLGLRVRGSRGVGCVPRDAPRDPVREAGGLAAAVQVPGRRGEGRVRAAAQHDATLLLRHGLHRGARLCAEGLARHALTDRHHHVDDELRVRIDRGIGVHLEVGEGPPLVEHAEAHLRVTRDGDGLAPAGHGRHEQLVVVGRHVVDDGHGGSVADAAVPVDAGPVCAHKLPPLGREQVPVGRRGERFGNER
jgi:hypothetical protein